LHTSNAAFALVSTNTNFDLVVQVSFAITSSLAGLVTDMFGSEDDIIKSPLIKDGTSCINHSK
jgi:hypothetical protein